MRKGLNLARLSLLMGMALMAPKLASAQIWAPEFSTPRQVHYLCQQRDNMTDNYKWKAVGEDGTTLGVGMRASGFGAYLIWPKLERKSDPITIYFTWPPEFSLRREQIKSLDKDQASLWFRDPFYSGEYGTAIWKKLRWSHYIVDRSKNLYVWPNKEITNIGLPVTGPVLITQPANDSSFRFDIKLDDLLAWSSGAQEVLVHKVGVAPSPRSGEQRKYNPYGERRLIYTIKLDMTEIRKYRDQAVADFEAWEETLADYKRVCTRQVVRHKMMMGTLSLQVRKRCVRVKRYCV